MPQNRKRLATELDLLAFPKEALLSDVQPEWAEQANVRRPSVPHGHTSMNGGGATHPARPCRRRRALHGTPQARTQTRSRERDVTSVTAIVTRSPPDPWLPGVTAACRATASWATAMPSPVPTSRRDAKATPRCSTESRGLPGPIFFDRPEQGRLRAFIGSDTDRPAWRGRPDPVGLVIDDDPSGLRRRRRAAPSIANTLSRLSAWRLPLKARTTLLAPRQIFHHLIPAHTVATAVPL